MNSLIRQIRRHTADSLGTTGPAATLRSADLPVVTEFAWRTDTSRWVPSTKRSSGAAQTSVCCTTRIRAARGRAGTVAPDWSSVASPAQWVVAATRPSARSAQRNSRRSTQAA